MQKFFVVSVVAIALCAGALAGEQTAPPTRVVVLGTGNPSADPERWGPAVAVVVNDRAYLVDCGPGVVRRAAAAEKNGIAALKAKELKIVFITHLHSDHTLGYPDLIFSPWVLGRTEPLEAYGPHGLKKMTCTSRRLGRKMYGFGGADWSRLTLADTKSTCMRFSREWCIATRTLRSPRFRLSMGYGKRRMGISSRLRTERL